MRVWSPEEPLLLYLICLLLLLTFLLPFDMFVVLAWRCLAIVCSSRAELLQWRVLGFVWNYNEEVLRLGGGVVGF